ncbi:MAG TPA: magnesium/cobalt transporter CorA [Acidimicrobiales bacterium]
MIAVRTFDRAGSHTVEDPADISEVVGDGRVVWVDLVDPTDQDLACVREEFELHPLAMEDARKHGQRPKLEQYPSHAFVVLYSKEHAEVDLFVGPNWLVSVRATNERGERCDIDGIRARFERTRGADTSVGFLLYTILDHIVDGYFSATESSEDRIEDFEERVFGEQTSDERAVQQELFQIRKELLVFRRRIAPLREILAMLLRGEVAWVSGSALVHLQDVYDHVLRAVDQIDSQREVLGNAVDAHLALISNRMNRVMKTMTSWGAILLGSTLIAGIYGMNFQHMPELGWKYGYPFALALMVVLTVVLAVVFRRRRWL